jgi:hypothetical protein
MNSASSSKYTELKWNQTELYGLGKAELIDIIPKFEPRTIPKNYNVAAEPTIHQMGLTEYVISYSNNLISIGVIRNKEDYIGEQPIVVQIGHWKQEDGKKLHVGCIIAIRSYSNIVPDTPRPANLRSSRSIQESDIILNDFLNATALAYEWAIIEKPEISQTLGSILSFNSQYQRTGNFLFSGTVIDKQYEEEFKVPDDLWPVYLKGGPPIGNAVILHWAQITGEYVVYTCENDLNLLLPQYAKPLLSADKMWAKPEFWLTWVDCRYSSV